jgi:acyl-CoA dehydrogenase
MTPSPSEARAAIARAREEVAAGWYDPHLDALLGLHGRAAVRADVRAFAAACAGRLDALAAEANLAPNLPQLRRWDAVGNRIEQVVLHPATTALGDAAWEAGILADWAARQDLDALAKVHLLAQCGEAGQCCPIACTAGLVRILQGTDAAVPEDWVSGLAARGADRLWASQFLTEIQGGSDVGANVLVARAHPDGGAALSGEKWFCSVIDAPLFLVTARPEGARAGTAGLGAYVVPRTRGGVPNGFAIRRLKDKLGTRSMASAEVDFDGAVAVRVGDFKDVVETVLNTSRVFNAVCCAGFMARAEREARAYARHRVAFGQPIARFPAVARLLARARTEAFAARSLSLRLAAWTPAGAVEQAAWRMLVNLGKSWTAAVAPSVIHDAIDVFGGNGAIEDFSVLPRLLRDSIVTEAWEGGHGVLSSQVLRDARRGLLDPLFDTLAAWAGPSGEAPACAAGLHDRLAECRARWARVVATPADASGEPYARDLVEELRPVAMAAGLLADLRAGVEVPALPEAIAHLLITTTRGWDPLADAGLAARVRVLVDA